MIIILVTNIMSSSFKVLVNGGGSVVYIFTSATLIAQRQFCDYCIYCCQDWCGTTNNSAIQ